MAINFPLTPAINDVHTDGDMSWKWDGSSWEAIFETNIPIPSQSGQAGEFLQTDGTVMTWESVITNPYDAATTSTGYFDLPSGTDAQRPGSPATGMLRYNSDQTQLEHYADGGWIGFAGSTPIITSISPTTSIAAGTVITVVGINFQVGTTVKLIGTDSSQYNAQSVTFVSSTNIQFSTPELPVEFEPYDVQLTLPNGGVAISTDIIDAGGVPAWTTAAGNLGTIPDDLVGNHFTLAATDPDSQIVTFSMDTANTTILTNAGFGLDGTTGVISGNPTDVGSPTTYNFDVIATDSTGVNSTTRSFSITVIQPYFSSASGGTITTYTDSGTNYKVHTFTSSAVFDAGTGGLADFLVVGGGGGAGGRHAGGGGAGGVVHVTGSTIPAGSHSMSVGGGGSRMNGDTQGNAGSNSTAFGETAVRGGASGAYVGGCSDIYDGGSGCGASDRNCNTSYGWDSKGAGNSTQGNPVIPYGGTGTKYGNKGGSTNYVHAGGGGGGAGEQGGVAGPDASWGGGVGGDGIQIDIDGNNYYWAGGGGGNHYGDNASWPGGDGGKGGGGGGGNNTGTGPGAGGTDGKNVGTAGGQYTCSNSGGDGGTNTGGGGGGGAGNTCFIGGSGGSGIVVIRYIVA